MSDAERNERLFVPMMGGGSRSLRWSR